MERIIRSTGGTDNPFHFGHLGGLSVLPVEQIIKPRTEVLEKVVEAAMQVEEDLPDPEKNLPHSETEVHAKPQKKKDVDGKPIRLISLYSVLAALTFYNLPARQYIFLP